MQLTDTVMLDGVRRTRAGYLVGDAKIARTGIQLYTAGEIGLTDRKPTDVIRVYRPADAVFDDAAMAGLAHKPLTNDHPSEDVTASNWKRLSVGMIGGDIKQDGKFVRVPLAIMDAETIADFEAGKREFSVGYSCELTMQDGKTPEGEAYDAVQSQIVPNHVALCRTARGGSDLRFGDDNPARGDKTMALKNILVDGLMVETTDAGEAAINKLKGMLDAAGKALETADAKHVAEVKAKDEELGKKDAEITELKGKVVDGAALDALVAERSTVLARAKLIAKDAKFDGLSNAEIKRVAVAASIGDEKVKDKSDDYVGALFDNLKVDGEGGDAIRDTVLNGGGNTTDAATKDATDARAAMLADLRGEKVAA